MKGIKDTTFKLELTSAEFLDLAIAVSDAMDGYRRKYGEAGFYTRYNKMFDEMYKIYYDNF